MKALRAIGDMLVFIVVVSVAGFLVMATAYGISAALDLGWF